MPKRRIHSLLKIILSVALVNAIAFSIILRATCCGGEQMQCCEACADRAPESPQGNHECSHEGTPHYVKALSDCGVCGRDAPDKKSEIIFVKSSESRNNDLRFLTIFYGLGPGVESQESSTSLVLHRGGGEGAHSPPARSAPLYIFFSSLLI